MKALTQWMYNSSWTMLLMSKAVIRVRCFIMCFDLHSITRPLYLDLENNEQLE